MTTTPAAEGWRMPAEWEPHAATWIAWPHEKSDWPGKFAPIPWVYGEVVRHLVDEDVNILVQDAAQEKRARAVLGKVGADFAGIHFFHIPTDRVWTRDSGPIFLINGAGKVAMTDWQFNAWAKYANWRRDDQVPARINKRLKMKRWQPKCHGQRVVLEGGSIDVNGRGLLLTTEECLLSPIQARNPHLKKDDIEATLCAFLGVERVLWLGQGITGDDTHGHVDDLARFVGPRTVVTVTEQATEDPNYEPLQENLRRLRAVKGLEVVELPMPAPLYFEGRRLPASYANFYIANGTVLVPTFNDANDTVAINILAKLFPTRRVVGIHAVDLVWGFGTLHCMTQQQPAGS